MIKNKQLIWHFFRLFGCIALACLIGMCYLMFSTPVYLATASLKLEEVQTELSMLSGVLPVKGYTSRVSTESHVIKSRLIVKNAVARLDWTVSYYLRKKGKKIEQYPLKPFTLAILWQDRALSSKELRIRFLKSGTVQLNYGGDKNVLRYRAGDTIKLPGVHFTCAKTTGTLMRSYYFIRFNKMEDVMNRVLDGLTISESAKFSAIALISKKDSNPAFAADAVNALVKAYIVNDRQQRITLSRQLITFIDGQLSDLYKKTIVAGNSAVDFKKRSGIADPHSSVIIQDERVINKWNTLARSHVIHQKIVDYLIEKRLEAQVSEASALPGVSLIDPATANYSPLYPVPYSVWRSSWLIGIFAGCVTIRLSIRQKPRAAAGR